MFIILFACFLGNTLAQGQPPVWEDNLQSTLSSTGVRENVSSGSVLGSLRARDPEGGTVTYSTDSTDVTVGQTSGVVTLARALDREVAASVPVSFRARDSSGQEIVASYSIKVVDVQDTPPVFENAPITFRVTEGLLPNNELGTVIVADGDRGVPNDLTVSITQDAQSLFRLGAFQVGDNKRYTVPVLNRQLIDREATGSSYTFTVTAQEVANGTTTSVSAQTQVTVTVVDLNDNIPQFSSPSYNFSLNEEPTRGTVLAGNAILVTDRDEGDNAYFELSIEEMPGSEFAEASKAAIYTLSPQSGTSQAALQLRVNNTLFFDYEQPQYRVHVMRLVARETRTSERRSSTATVHVYLSDVNDNFPLFAQTQYVVSVREDRAVGHLVATITATDADSVLYSTIRYSLTGTDNDVFQVNSTTGEIRVARALDFETRSRYDLECIANDGLKSTSVRFVVNVLDFNDQGPVFTPTSYSTVVGESSIEMQPSITISARDADSDLPVTYRIVGGNDLGVFDLHPQTGVFTLRRPVSFSETPGRGGVFEVVVDASDNTMPVPQTSTVIVVVNVRDENDNTPVFSETSYVRTIRETDPPGTSVVRVEAEDLDAGLNAHIDFFIRSGGRDNFALDLTSGEITVSNTANLDIDQNGRQYILTVLAVDRGSPPQTGTATVSVNVLDVNNKVPSFGQDLYLLTVPEDAAVGTSVGRPVATDLDSNPNLQYRVLNGSIRAQNPAGDPVTDTRVFDYLNAFDVNPTTGQISSRLPLKHDLVNQVNFTLVAEDLNAENPSPQRDTTAVEIRILRSGGSDISFSPPWSPEDPSYTLYVAEELPWGRSNPFTQLVAQDPVSGAPISDYREVPGTDPNDYFGVEQRTGGVFSTSRLDYETLAQHELTFQVYAYTNSTPVRSAAATLRVIVTDINDNSPQFESNNYGFAVSEGRVNPSEVGRVRAIDRDSTNYSSITYSISGPGDQHFHINPDTGVISVAPNRTLDRETQAIYNLLVTASDNPSNESGEQARRTSVPLTITLQDENDNAPSFTRPIYTIYTADRRERDKILGQVTARDPDAGNNGRVEYRMLTANTPPVIPELFYVQTNGTIRTNKLLQGYARVAPYEFRVRAQDIGSFPRSADVTVQIYIQDNQTQGGDPQIDSPSEDGAEIVTPEELDPGSEVTRINASSNDPTVQLEFSFVVNDALRDDANRFTIDPEAGVIRVKERLDRETQQVYELIIMVRDSKGREVVRRILIRLSDIDDNLPSFECPNSPKVDPIRARVPENQRDTQVVEVQACDADGEESEVFYYILDGNDPDVMFNGSRPFRINDSGLIYTNVGLDREHIEEYTLLVLASNSPNVTDDLTSSDEDGRRRKRQTADGVTTTRDDVIRVIVTVEDEDDNGPRFDGQNGASGNRLVAGVLMTARPGTTVTRLQAADSDTTSFLLFTIDNEVFYGMDDERVETPRSFTIDARTGEVKTNLENYVKWADGYFQMDVIATDPQDRVATAQLWIYVARESQRLRFIFDQPPEETNTVMRPFIAEVTEFQSELSITPDLLHYHATRDGDVDLDKSDLCFHVVRNNRVMNVDRALDELDVNVNADLDEIYDSYNVIDVDVCTFRTTTMWWWGWWWLWWILIAEACFILLACLICICCVCVCWSRYGKYSQPREKPYKVLMNQSASYLPPATDYDWQEDTVKMD